MCLLAWHNMEQRDYQDKTILIDNITNRVMFSFKNKDTNDLSWSDNILEATSGHNNITVCCSGGLDSDVMLRLFHKHRNVKCLIGRWMDNGVCYNDYDIQYAVQTCEELSIPYKYVDVNFANFFDNGEFISYATAYKCSSPQLCLHLKMFDIIGEDVFSKIIKTELINQSIEKQMIPQVIRIVDFFEHVSNGKKRIMI